MFQRITAHAGGVVMVSSVGINGLDFLGSGFLCHNKGYIITSAHILTDLTANIVISQSQPIDKFVPRTLTHANALAVTVAQYDPINDVALLKLEQGATVSLLPNWAGRGEDAPVGSSVGILGIPFGSRGLHTVKLTGSLISGRSITDDGSHQFHIDANIHEGNSGGPVVSVSTNQIIGIVSGRFSPTGSHSGLMIGNFSLGQDSTISFATPIEYGLILMREEGLNV